MERSKEDKIDDVYWNDYWRKDLEKSCSQLKADDVSLKLAKTNGNAPDRVEL